MRFSRWMAIVLMGAALGALDLADVFAQRGGRGGGGRGGGGGGADLRASRRGQYEDFPWDARKLLETHGQILGQMPAPIRVKRYQLHKYKVYDIIITVDSMIFIQESV